MVICIFFLRLASSRTLILFKFSKQIYFHLSFFEPLMSISSYALIKGQRIDFIVTIVGISRIY